MRLSWLDPQPAPCTLDDLHAAGVLYQRLSVDPEVYEPVLDELCRTRGYVKRDEVGLRPDTPDLPAVLARFADEHLHTEDEVRFVLQGAGIFDIRSADDRFMRVIVEAGDLLVVPRGRYHRFFLTEEQTIRCVRLFQDPAGWSPVYRTA
jgi:1,2-dihydroxy-3-keto-5-methylthiopentene dioxygenase